MDKNKTNRRKVRPRKKAVRNSEFGFDGRQRIWAGKCERTGAKLQFANCLENELEPALGRLCFLVDGCPYSGEKYEKLETEWSKMVMLVDCIACVPMPQKWQLDAWIADFQDCKDQVLELTDDLLKGKAERNTQGAGPTQIISDAGKEEVLWR